VRHPVADFRRIVRQRFGAFVLIPEQAQEEQSEETTVEIVEIDSCRLKRPSNLR